MRNHCSTIGVHKIKMPMRPRGAKNRPKRNMDPSYLKKFKVEALKMGFEMNQFYEDILEAEESKNKA